MFIKNKKTGNIIFLRPFGESDIHYWQKWDIDPEVQQYMPEPENIPVSDSEQLTYLEECANDENGIYATIEINEGSYPVGTISITEISWYHGVGELGIVLGDKAVWGKGVATEAIKLLLQVAKEEKLRRITAEYEEGNQAIEKALINNGFEMEGNFIKSRIKKEKEINTIKMVKFI